VGDKDQSAARLLNLIIVLRLRRQGMTAEEIRNHLGGINERAFERMKATLKREFSAELWLDDSGRYHLGASGANLPDLSFSHDEYAAISLALRQWAESDVAQLASAARTKLKPLDSTGTLATNQTIDGLDTALTGGAPGLAQILTAANEERELHFSYQTASTGVVSNRRVSPWLVGRRGRAWYLLGLDLDLGQTRVFNLTRVNGEIQLGSLTDPGQAARPDPSEARRLLRDSLDRDQLCSARVKASPQAGRVLEREGAQALGDGTWQVSATTASRLADWGNQIEVLNDPYLRSRVRQLLQATAVAHQGEGAKPKRYPGRAAAAAGQRRTRRTSSETAARIASMLAYLKDKPASIDELAHEFSVTPATVRSELELAYMDVGRGQFGGELVELQWSDDGTEVSLVDSQGLDRPLGLGAAEGVALIGALRALEQMPELTETASARSARHKLEAAVGGLEIIDLSLPPAGPQLRTVRSAIGQGRRLVFDYVDQTGAASRRQVDPGWVFADGDHWLVAAWDVPANAQRLFRLDRMSNVQLSETAARPHRLRRTDSANLGRNIDQFELQADVVFSSSSRWKAEELKTLLPPVNLPGGAVQVRLGVIRTDWLVRLALGGGGDIEVLRPAETRELIERAALSALE
jgi:proteasome accessory factor C